MKLPVPLLVAKLSLLNKYGVTPPVADNVILPSVKPQLVMWVTDAALAVGLLFTLILVVVMLLHPVAPVTVTV